MKPIRVYVAGPITRGDYLANVRLAIDAAQQLREAGLFPFIPHSSALWHLVHHREYNDWMEQDFVWLEQCHALLRVPGESSGADREVVHAGTKNIPVFHTVEAVIEWARDNDLIVISKADEVCMMMDDCDIDSKNEKVELLRNQWRLVFGGEL